MAKGRKTGGRTKGTPNKLTKELRSVLKDVLHSEIEQLPEHFDKLEPKDRIELLAKLMPYAMPKVNPVNSDVGEPLEFNW